MIAPLRGIARVRLKASDLMRELRLGILTRGAAPENNTEQYCPYAIVPYAGLQAILARLELQRDNVFVDLGCGRGRVVRCAARFTVREVIGVDISPDRLTVAQANVKVMRGRRCRWSRYDRLNYVVWPC